MLAAVVAALPLAAQDSPLFPRFSVTGGSFLADFETDVRVDDEGGAEGTAITLERDLGLDDSKTLTHVTVQWRPFSRHELGGAWFRSEREGFEAIDREIVFRDEVYPVQAEVTTTFDLEQWRATYTYWARKGERDGFGITLGVAGIALDASLIAVTPGSNVTITQEAETEVPVALAGAQFRFAPTDRILGEVSGAFLPRVTIGEYSGDAVTAAARIEYRLARWLGLGAAYNYFQLDGAGDRGEFRGELGIGVQGVEGYVRLAF